MASISRMPSTASRTRIATSARSMRAARLHDAHVVDVLLQEPRRAGCRRCPRTGSACRPRTSRLSTASRVVPGMGETTARSVAEQPVQQRRLADVGPADERDAQRRAPRPPATSTRGRPVERRVQQVAHALAVLGRDRRRMRSKPSARELRQAVVLALRPCSPRPARVLPPRRRRGRDRAGRPAAARRAPSTTKTTRSASSMARSRLVGGRAQQRVVGAQQQAAGVDQLEGGALPGGLRVVAVARGARAGCR